VQPVTHEEVVAALGEVDEVVIAEVVGTGATAAELAEAQAWVANDEAMMNNGRPLAAGRVGRLVEILAAMAEERDLPAAGPAP
jgi:hypothetical protein